MLRRVDMAAGVQPHVDAAHDLAGAARRFVFLDRLHPELHLLLETRGRAHREVLRIEFEAYVDDLKIRRQHETSFAPVTKNGGQPAALSVLAETSPLEQRNEC